MSNQSDTIWSAAVSAELETLHATGLSHSLIAESLNAKFGLHLTRSACIGRVRRMGLAERPKIRERERVARKLQLPMGPKWSAHARRCHQSTPQPPRPVLVDVKAPEGEGVSMDQLLPFAKNAPTSCRYPLGISERGMMFCGETTHRGSWCAYHCEVVFQGGRRAA
jgi:GcrA cell cycle regulator